MAVIAVNGLPGQGKTLLTTHLAKKHYRKTNSRLRRFFRYLRRKPQFINNVYSNYPICLNKRKNVYSNIVSIDDLKNQYSFQKDSCLIFDEIQIFYDSDEHKNFPREIANFNQLHRHFGIKDIYYVSQHPSRIVKKLRNVVVKYYRIKKCVRIPILSIGWVSARVAYEFEDYEEAFTKDKEIRRLKDIERKIFFINFRKVYKAYDTVYMKPLNADKPLLTEEMYSTLGLEEESVRSLEKRLFERARSEARGRSKNVTHKV